MSAFIAKLDKPTYANIKFIKQATGVTSDEELLRFVVYSAASEINAQLKQLEEHTNSTESDSTPEGAAIDEASSTDEA